MGEEGDGEEGGREGGREKGRERGRESDQIIQTSQTGSQN